MSTYEGQWPEKFTEAAIKVTVDGQALPRATAEVPAPGQTYGWGNFSTWAGRKLLSYSLLQYEIHNVMGLPESSAHRHLIDIADLFMEEKVAKLGKQWTMTSDEIGQWISEKYPRVWHDIASHHHTPA